ncbi:hypothetical protein IKF15_02745 [Candidatus Saccharibacteria bacterium]|nr:hypothetical protein [Candidatus Saccharibacteria bacterium]
MEELKQIFDAELTDDSVAHAFGRLVAERLPDDESVSGDRLADEAFRAVFDLTHCRLDNAEIEPCIVEFLYSDGKLTDALAPRRLGRSLGPIVKSLIDNQTFIKSYLAQSRRYFGQ